MSDPSHAGNTQRIKAGPRVMAILGPYGSGMTTLLESIAAVTGAVPRKGALTAFTSGNDSDA